MRDFVIVTDSTTDLPIEFANKYGLTVLPLGFLDERGNEYKNTLNHRDMSIKVFYDLMRNGAMFKTNQVNVLTYQELFKTLKRIKEIFIYVFLHTL